MPVLSKLELLIVSRSVEQSEEASRFSSHLKSFRNFSKECHQTNPKRPARRVHRRFIKHRLHLKPSVEEKRSSKTMKTQLPSFPEKSQQMSSMDSCHEKIVILLGSILLLSIATLQRAVFRRAYNDSAEKGHRVRHWSDPPAVQYIALISKSLVLPE